jgi:hypothetical protein
MKKETKIIVGVIVALGAVVGAMYLGIIPDRIGVQTAVNGQDLLPESACNVNLQVSKMEMFTVLETMFNNDLDYAHVSPYIDSLHMTMYGCNNMNAQTLLEQFEASYSVDGWSSQVVMPQARSDWMGYHEIWTRGTDARSVSVAEGAGVTLVFPEYATVYLIAYGPATTYYQFYNEVNS